MPIKTKARKTKQYYVLIERDLKLSIQNVRCFAEELSAWTAYETSNAPYATIHASSMYGSKKLSSEKSERYADEMPDNDTRFGTSPDW